MYNIEKTHYVLDEMVLNGCIVEANKTNVLSYIKELDKAE
jgi:AP-4 complex subunit sigma-1